MLFRSNEQGIADGKLVKLLVGYYDTKFIDLLLSKNATDDDTYNTAVSKEKDK